MLSVGQKLYWVPSHRWNMDEQEVTIEKVGRKWATIAGGRYRIDVTTLRADGGKGSCPGVCYLDKNAFLEEREAKKEWDNFRGRLGYCPPKGVSLLDIKKVMEILKFGN